MRSLQGVVTHCNMQHATAGRMHRPTMFRCSHLDVATLHHATHITLQQTRDDNDDDLKRINSTRNRLSSMMVHLLPDSRVVGHLRAQPAPSEENEQRDARVIARIVASACQPSGCASVASQRSDRQQQRVVDVAKFGLQPLKRGGTNAAWAWTQHKRNANVNAKRRSGPRRIRGV